MTLRGVAASALLGLVPVVTPAWELPADKAVLAQDAVREIVASTAYAESSAYRSDTAFIDFTSHGQKFTQVVVVLTPEQPRLHRGKRIVVVGGEPGSEWAGDFLQTPEGGEGPGVWLAKRGVTFVGLTRVGRWNFFARDGSGSWADIPIEQRMPILSRLQAAPWTSADYEVKRSATREASSGDSSVYRVPRPESPLYAQMLATTPLTYLKGYRLAIEHAVPPARRSESMVLFWGMSTGGAFLYPLARHYQPDGYLGWGTSSTGLAYAYRKARGGDFTTAYTPTALRLRERGLDDFTFYTKELDEATRTRWWQASLREPRFKSGEDAPMQFNVASLSEVALRLWLSDFLPADERKPGLAQFMREMIEPSFPPEALKEVAILDINGTRDEAIPPRTVDAHREVMEPYARRYRVARVDGMQHYLYRQDSIKVAGHLWLRFIESGYFDR
ncbi:MAG: hypothetical protein M3Z16_03645 [Pseudomonadota bacterium]|nr:hypothetical protein [Pseudomonadota bacterium]